MCKKYATEHNSRIQRPQALWPAVGRQERLWGTGIYYRRISAVKTGIQSKKKKKVSPGDEPLAKEPEDTGYEIV